MEPSRYQLRLMPSNAKPLLQPQQWPPNAFAASSCHAAMPSAVFFCDSLPHPFSLAPLIAVMSKLLIHYYDQPAAL